MVLSLLLLEADAQSVFGFGGSTDEVYGDGETVDEELSSAEQAQVEDALQDLTSQFQSQVKQHMTEQIKAHKAGSKLGLSKVVPSALHVAAANNQVGCACAN